MKDLRLVALVSGNRKDGSGKWFRATLKGHNKDGLPVVNDFYLSQEVGEKAVRDGIVEDCNVNVSLHFDDYMRPEICDITKATGSSGAKSAVTV